MKTSLAADDCLGGLLNDLLRSVMKQLKDETGSLFISTKEFSECMLLNVGVPAICTGLMSILSCDPDPNLYLHVHEILGLNFNDLTSKEDLDTEVGAKIKDLIYGNIILFLDYITFF
jgi:hypothetical protein